MHSDHAYRVVRKLREHRLAGLGPQRCDHRLHIRVPGVVRRHRQDVIPDRGEAADQLRDPGRPGHEPPVQVFGAVAPAADVNAPDVADASDRSLDAGQQHAALCREVIGQIARLCVVRTRVQEDDEGQAVRPRRQQPPVIVGPDEVVVRFRTGPALNPALAVSRRLALDRRQERAWSHLAVEGELRPLVDSWHPERVCGSRIECFWSLEHARMVRR